MGRSAATSRTPDAPRHEQTLLVVEPDMLLQWSLARYLGRWFSVVAAKTPGEARHLSKAPDVLIISDGVENGESRNLATWVQKMNPEVRIIRIAAAADQDEKIPENEFVLEKPFALPHLAHLLGIRDGGTIGSATYSNRYYRHCKML